MNSVSRLCSRGQTFRILTFVIHVMIRSTLVWAERTLFPSLILRISIDIHHDRSNRNQRAAEDRGGFYRLAEDRCAENDAEQDSGVVVDTDLGCRGEAVSVGDEYLAQGAEEADQHEQHKLTRVRHNEIADDERQGTEHAEG